MNIPVAMPQMGESVAEGTIIRWLKNPGDRVARDEAILEITTDKVDTEVPSPVSGVLGKILVPAGATVPVGEPIAIIEADAAAASETKKTEESGHFKASPHELVTFSRQGSTGAAAARAVAQPIQARRHYSPSVLIAALSGGLSLDELNGIRGTGFHGRVTPSDVARFAKNRPRARRDESAASATPVPGWLRPVIEDGDRVVEMMPSRRAIAEHVSWSRRLAAHATAFADVDMSRIVALKMPDVSYLAFFSIAVVELLKKHPIFNACVLDDGRVLYKSRVRLGIAVAVDDDLFVPVIRDADELNRTGLARAIGALTEKARSRKLTPDDVRGGTFTITNPGMFGGTSGTPIINQPQVAILGLGAIVRKPVAVEDEVQIRPMMTLSLSFDHRVIDGALGFNFLESLRTRLERFE